MADRGFVLGGADWYGLPWGWLMRWLAVLAMLVDHCGAVLGWGVPWSRIVGRLALPWFLLLAMEGVGRTRSPGRYVERLLLWAVLAQVPYWCAFGWFRGNVLVTLGVAVFLASRAWWRWGLLVAWAGVCVEQVLRVHVLDGGCLSVVAVVLGVHAGRWRGLVVAGCMGLLYWAWPVYAVAAWAAVGVAPWVRDWGSSWLWSRGRGWYAFYPGHLVCLSGLRFLLECGL